MTDTSKPIPEFMLSAELKHGRRVFESTLAAAQDLMSKGVPPSAIISGLLGVVSEVGGATCGRRELRRLLMQVADSLGDETLDA